MRRVGGVRKRLVLLELAFREAEWTACIRGRLRQAGKAAGTRMQFVTRGLAVAGFSPRGTRNVAAGSEHRAHGR
jgi:hypothetical protein